MLSIKNKADGETILNRFYHGTSLLDDTYCKAEENAGARHEIRTRYSNWSSPEVEVCSVTLWNRKVHGTEGQKGMVVRK